ncbi:peptidoglycan-associated lipoprotein Pal [Hyphococcus luteus]|uniref:Peptidoglycan-associated lipoprotein n=1 Tax=Hyphococcus luteus TaxID=2058213 RepID=A0A2S7K803_9PROT|nr:peptidoglycan-associated lipoprotein Pal [Marinicaulis flavus]PQA88635.1 peptidoglycan-associated lipoprotein [Marinicaulis flavus]
MNKFLKVAGIFASLALISACASTGPDVDTTDSADTMVDTGPSGPVPGTQADLEQSAGHRVFFAFDQYTLTPEAQSTLAKQAAWLKEYPETRILVAGNCDERGTREYNLALGARRAEAAKSYLVSLGVDAARITTVSYGKERPIDPRSTEAAWSLNRNATTTITSTGA